MGQALMKLVPGIFWNPTYRGMALKLVQAGDESYPGLLSIWIQEIAHVASFDRGEQNKDREIGSTLEECYNKFLAETADKLDFADFYQAICKTVEEINKKLKSTQFRPPDKEKLEQVYKSHYEGNSGTISKEDFQKILQEVIIQSGFTGLGSKDILLFIFGVPAVALFLKQSVAPKAIPNDVFIPVVTSATVYLLAKFNKI